MPHIIGLRYKNMTNKILSERELKIIEIKAELFDLQNKMGSLRVIMEEKLKELNQLIKLERGD